MFNLTINQAEANPGVIYTYVTAHAEELTITQENAGGHGVGYTYITPKGPLHVQDVSDIPWLSDGHQAIVITYEAKAWLYRFDVGQDPPQEPVFTIFADNEMSLTGNGTLIPFNIFADLTPP